MDYSMLHGLTPEFLRAPALAVPKENSSLLDRSLGYLLGAVPSAVEGVSKTAGTIAGFDGSFLDPKTEITPADTTGGKIVDLAGSLLPVGIQFAVGSGPVGAVAKATGLAKSAPILTNIAKQAAGFGAIGAEQDRTTGAESAGEGALIGASHALPISARIPVAVGLGLLSKAIFEARNPDANKTNVPLVGTMAMSLLHPRIGKFKARPTVPDNFATVAKEAATTRGKFAAAAEQPVINPITQLPKNLPEPTPFEPQLQSNPPGSIQVPAQPVVTSPSGHVDTPVEPVAKAPVTPTLAYDYSQIGASPEPVGFIPKLSPIGVPAEIPRPEPVPQMPVPTIDPPPLVETAIEKAHRDPTNRPALRYGADRVGELGGVAGTKPNLPNPVLPADLKIDSILDQVIPMATRAAVGGAAGAILDPEDRVGGALAGASIGILGPKLVDMATELKPALKGKLGKLATVAKTEEGAVGGGGGMKIPITKERNGLFKGTFKVGDREYSISASQNDPPHVWEIHFGSGGSLSRTGDGFFNIKKNLLPVLDSLVQEVKAVNPYAIFRIAANETQKLDIFREQVKRSGYKLLGDKIHFDLPEKISPHSLVPALLEKGKTEPIVGNKGETHADIKARQPQDWRDANVLADVEGAGAQHGFWDGKRFLTREGASDKLGLKEPLQSETLRDLQSLQKPATPVHPTETPEFKEWFGKSKVIDAEGKPLVVYHGTPKDFNAFESQNGGIWFTDKPQYADHFSGMDEGKWGEGSPQVKPVFLRAENLYEPTKIEGPGIFKRAKEGGYDGIKWPGGEYVVFEPNQIKSAIGNSGEFSLKSNDIRGAIIPELGSYMTRAAVGGIVGGLIGGHYDTNGDNGGFIAGALLAATAAAVGPEIALATIKKIGKAELPPPAKGLNEMGALKKTFEQRVEERSGAVIHGSTRVADRLVNWLDKSFNMTMPESVSRTLRIAEGTATHMLDTMDSAMRKLSIFYKAPQELKDAANKYLDGAITRDQFLQPLQTEADKTYANYVVAARESIDGLQRMLASGIGSDSKSKLINESLGKYVTRSFKLFTRDNWTPEPSTVDTLAQKLRSEKAWEGASDGEIKDYLYSYIREVNTTKGMYRGSNSKVGESIDQHVLKPREKLDPEWRAFLGEITNPAERISQTLYRLRPMSAASKFMHDIAVNMTEDGMPHYFQDRGTLDAFKAKTLQSLQNATSDEAKSSLQGMLTKLDNFQPVESLPKYGQLRGGLVSRNVWNTLSTFDSVTGLGNHPLMRSVSGLNVAAKLSNTALNPISFVRNVFQIPMMMAIGRASMNDVYEGLKILHDPEHPLRAEIISQGIGSVDQLKQEIFRDFNTATEGKYNFSNMDSSNLSLGRMDADVASKAFGKLSNKYLDIYRSPDNSVRIGTYLSAKRRISEALGKDMNDPVVIQKATDFTNRYTMDYGAVAPIIKNVRQIPGVNLYISYISEMTRITKNIMEDVIHGKGDGLTAHDRLYASMPIAFLGVLPEVMNQQAEASLSPKDRSDWEKVKNLMPDYARTRYRASITRQADGNFKYVDFTSLMPTDFLHQTGKAAANGDWSAFLAVNPIAGLDNSPALNILVEQTTGQDIHTHREFRGFQDRVASVAKEITPPWLSIGREGKKFEQAYTPTQSGELGLTNLRTGQRLTPQDFWLPYETALRSGSYNLSALELQYTNEVKRDIANNSAYLNDILKSDASEQVKTREKLKFAKVQNQILSAWQERLGLAEPKQ